MNLSEIDVPLVKENLRQDSDEDDKLIGAILEGAKDYIVKYTGRSLEQLEESEDLTIAVLVLVAEFYDNRTINVNDRLNLRMNMMLESLLGRHSVNLL
ncbi:MAG: head-tail connector protein [Zhenhengia sp.]|uniref:head-tail connector protein n=1 Tax=Zhenhengia sp. TaxID=2944208 RepID=UPI003992D334